MKMVNLLNETHDFLKHDKSATKIWKGVMSKKRKT